MRSNVLLVMALVAGAAFGGGYLIGSQSSDTRTPSPNDELVSTTEPSDSSGEDKTDAPLLHQPQLKGSSGDTSTIRGLIRSIPTDEPVRGDGEITGIVKTSSGDPVPGVVVTANPAHDMRARWKNWEQMSAEERLLTQFESLVESERRRRSHELSATTDAAGTFVLRGVTDAKHTLRAFAEGWRISSQMMHNVEVGAHVEFLAARVTKVKFDLVRPSGEVPTRASIRLKGESTHHLEWRSANVPLTLKPGTFSVKVTAGEYQELVGQLDSFVVEEGKEANARIVLEARPTLIVDIKFPDGQESTAVPIAIPWKKSTPPSEATMQARATSPRHVRSFGRGSGSRETVLSDLPEGTVAIGVVRGGHFHPGHQVVEAIELIELDAGVTRHTIHVPKLAPHRYVSIGPRWEAAPEGFVSSRVQEQHCRSLWGRDRLCPRG